MSHRSTYAYQVQRKENGMEAYLRGMEPCLSDADHRPLHDQNACLKGASSSISPPDIPFPLISPRQAPVGLEDDRAVVSAQLVNERTDEERDDGCAWGGSHGLEWDAWDTFISPFAEEQSRLDR